MASSSAADEAILAVFRAVLPEGSAVELDAPPQGEGAQFGLLVRRGGARCYVIPRHVPMRPEFLEQIRIADPLPELRAGRARFRPFRVRYPEGAAWPLLGASDRPLSLVWFNTTGKHVAVYLDAESGSPVAVLKVAAGPLVARGLVKEHQVLLDLDRRRPGIGPRPLALGGRLPDGGGPAASLQTFLAGRQVAPDDAATAWDYISLLGLPGESVALRGLAARLGERLRSSDELRSVRPPLESLLARVRDERPLPASLAHGDLKPGNLLHAAAGGLAAIDWELAEAPSLGFLDLVVFELFPRFADPANDSYAAVLDEGRRSVLEDYRARAFGAAAPSLDELLALGVARYLIDRFGTPWMREGWAAGRPAGEDAWLGRLLASPWPLS